MIARFTGDGPEVERRSSWALEEPRGVGCLPWVLVLGAVVLAVVWILGRTNA